MESIKIKITISAPLTKVWEYYTIAEHIMKWNFASNDWECPKATITLEQGKKFNYTMAAKDKSMQFDFGGTFTKIVPHKVIEYDLEDKRTVSTTFNKEEDKVIITQVFDAEESNSTEMQKQGWMCILENFRKHCEDH